jgi:multicomponent Na+:H+ antiporter subunit B
MKTTGMTPIVKNVTRLVTGFIAVFGIYIALTGHVGPGGGFAGGVILAAAIVLVVLAFGGAFSRKLLTERQSHLWDAAGAFGFLLIALLGYFSAGFFRNWLPHGTEYHIASGGMIAPSNLAIFVKVGAGMAGVFLALAAFRIGRPKE